MCFVFFIFFFQAEDGIRDAQESRGLGDVYKRQVPCLLALSSAVLPHRSWQFGSAPDLSNWATISPSPMAHPDIRAVLASEPEMASGFALAESSNATMSWSLCRTAHPTAVSPSGRGSSSRSGAC
eukprot:TRINITY_DN23471_c0_g1_i1.p2 TRINITY_DN23471_c0_g1~~TRINITY_DN23471_c0_g1_i1.p2  ORF type:complete len:125 (+),score=26.44 TRINITY_DN23471_c0_g1_i1:64-438(+)